MKLFDYQKRIEGERSNHDSLISIIRTTESNGQFGWRLVLRSPFSTNDSYICPNTFEQKTGPRKTAMVWMMRRIANTGPKRIMFTKVRIPV